MNSRLCNSNILTVVTPISRMAGRLKNLECWLKEVRGKNIEVILIHDVQDEITGKCLIELIRTINVPNLKLFSAHFGNPGSARNKGLTLATGEWVCFWDSDDLPDLGETLTILESKIFIETDCIVSSYQAINDLSHVTTTFLLNSKFENAIGQNPGLWRFFFKRESLMQTKFPPLKMAEDQIFLASYFSKSRNIEIIPNITYKYFFGGEDHLTKNIAAFKDLSRAAKLTLSFLKNTDYPYPELISIMFVKQTLSGFRYSAPQNKLHIGLLFGYGISILPLKIKLQILTAMKTVFRSYKSRKY